jgi:DAK2 domain fusion protein YloV
LLAKEKKNMAKSISGSLFKKMITNGAINLKNNHQEINHLNVFPVPDGDTGTNMQMTIMAGVKEVTNSKSKSIVDVSKILSRGCLMGARGNSGVILSQFFRGLYAEISTIKNGSATIDEFINALIGGYQMAYKAVMTPVEGTILTVVREAADAVHERKHEFNTIEEVLSVYLDEARVSLENTPELLPVLKEAGVVDSGGAGFIRIIEGMLWALQGEMLQTEVEPTIVADKQESFLGHGIEEADIKFAYCTEFIVKLTDQENFDKNSLKNILENMGDSLVIVHDDDLLKVHVHTNQPGVVITLGQKYGELQTMKVDNMKLQHSDIVETLYLHEEMEEKIDYQPINEVRKEFAVISVCFGEGIKQAFSELGVDYIIDGGQTMNPPTEEFIKAIEAVNAENVIILPNNSNVILTAEQTLDICENANVRVLKTKSIAQGYAALMVFDTNQSLDDNVEAMSDVMNEIKTGELTYAVRDTKINGFEIKVGDFIGISKGEIKAHHQNRLDAIKNLVKEMVDDYSEIATIFYGMDVPENEVNLLRDYLLKLNSDLEVELVNGKQEIYHYVVSIE